MWARVGGRLFVPATGVEAVSGDQDVEEILAAATERVQQLAEQAGRDVDQVMAGVQQQIDDLKADVRAATGLEVEIPWQPSPPVPTVMDASMSYLAETAEGCRHLLAAVELLRPLVEPGSELTVGAAVKARLDARAGALVLDHLHRSGLFLDDEEACDG